MRRKSTLEVVKLVRDETKKRNEERLQKLTPHLTPIAAMIGIVVSAVTIFSLIGSYNSAL